MNNNGNSRKRVVSTCDVLEVELSVPAGHRHLRTSLKLREGEELEFQEATIAAIVRAYVRIKTDPRRRSVRLCGVCLDERKADFAAWQLMEEDG